MNAPAAPQGSTDRPDDDLQTPHRQQTLPGAAGAKSEVVLSTDEEISPRRPSTGVPLANDTEGASPARGGRDQGNRDAP